MTTDIKIETLVSKHGLDKEDFFVKADGDETQIVIRRTGLDKLEANYPSSVRVIREHMCPYKSGVMVMMVGEGFLYSDPAHIIQKVASSSPDNTKSTFYPDVAHKRLRHKILLSLLNLYQENIYSEVEDKDFTDEKVKSDRGSFEKSAEEAVAEYEKAQTKKAKRRA